jgi:CHASE2 domain
MAGSDRLREAEKIPSGHRHHRSAFRRLWRWSAPLREGCAALGFLLVFVIEIANYYVVPIVVPLLVPTSGPLFEDGNYILARLPITVAGYIRPVVDGSCSMLERVGLCKSSPPLPSINYTFVDIDDKTFSLTDWRSDMGDHTNRSKIEQLIANIVGNDGSGDNKPRAVVIDIDLSDLNREDKDDRILNDYIRNYSKHGPPLIFVRSLRESGKEVFEPNGQIYSASAGFLRSSDGSVRRWLLAEPDCGRGDKLQVIPSVELLLVLLLVNDDHSWINETLQSASSCSPNSKVDPIRLGDGRPEIALWQGHLRGRIVYAVKWYPSAAYKLGNDLRYLYISGSELFLKFYGDKLPEVDRQNLFKNRVVIIGGSNEASRDNHITPYGPMPGAVVLLNAIESLRVHDQIIELTGLTEIGIGILMGLIVWFLLEFLRVEMGPFVCIIGYLGAVILSAVLLSAGVWFGVSGVVVGALAHFLSSQICRIGRDIWPNKFGKLRAPEFQQRHDATGG